MPFFVLFDAWFWYVVSGLRLVLGFGFVSFSGLVVSGLVLLGAISVRVGSGEADDQSCSRICRFDDLPHPQSGPNYSDQKTTYHGYVVPGADIRCVDFMPFFCLYRLDKLSTAGEPFPPFFLLAAQNVIFFFLRHPTSVIMPPPTGNLVLRIQRLLVPAAVLRVRVTRCLLVRCLFLQFFSPGF